MKKGRLFSTLAAALVTASMLVALPMNVGAAGSNYSPTLTTTDDKKVTRFNKYLVMDTNANVPNATFTYSITSGIPITADTTAGKLAVLAGVGTPTIETATFMPTDATYSEAEATTQNDTVVFNTSDNTDEKYAKKTLTIDFSSVIFTEPGVYRYVITESGTNQGVTNDNISKRTLDVYVEDDSNATEKQLKITGYVMYSDEINKAPSATVGESKIITDIPNGAEAGTKSNSYTNTYKTHDLTFGKEVTGNQGSKDKYFKFTVNISNAVKGTVYGVDLTNADTTSGTNAATLTENQNKNNSASITVGSDGTVSTDFYLQHGQSIVIKGIADGTAYTITEEQEDYKPSTKLSDTSDKKTGENEGTDITIGENQNSISDTAIKADTEVTFTNNRNGVIPTGILISVAPAAIVGICVIGGIVFLIAKNKRRESEED